MNFALIQAAAALAFATPLIAQAAPQRIEQLPRVVITGKAQPAAQQVVVQLPRVVIEGRSSTLMALNTSAKSAARRA
ncbi:MAG TPA: hypothetical protein VJN44_01155 [Roseateles sp.]|nr:hypothetical protein [Roseateles sp.]